MTTSTWEAWQQPLPIEMGAAPAMGGGMPSLPGLPNMTAPGNSVGAAGGLFGDMTGMQKISAGLSGLQTLAGLWGAWQSMKMAKKQFNFTKDMMNANLGNSVKSYNTALTDRITSRAHMQGMSSAEAQAYLNSNKLNTKGT